MANLIKGLTVEIGGDTTKLGKALEDVNKKSSALSSELGQINKLLKMDPGNTELLAQKQEVLSEAIANTAKKLETLKEAEKQVQAQFERGEVSEEQVRALQREIITTTSKMESYERAAKETADTIEQLGKESDDAQEEIEDTGEEADDAAKELDDMGDSADKAGSKMSGLGSACQAAGKAIAATAAAAGAAIAGMGAALVDMTVEGAAYADTVLTESTVTGIATDKLQEYMYAAELVDVSTETLTKSMAKQIKSMKAVQDGTALSVEAYEKLGVEVMNADGTLRDSDTVYWEVIDALGKMENETERDALAMQILGKSAQELNPLIEAGAEKMTELGKQAQEAGYVLSDDMLNAYGALDDQLQYLSVGADAAKNALGTVLLPVLTDLAGEGVDLLSEFTAGIAAADGDISAMADVVAEVLPKAIDKILEYVPQVLEVATAIVGALGTALLDNLPMLTTVALDLATSLVTGLLQELPTITRTFMLIVEDAISALSVVLPDLIATIVDVVPGIITNLLAYTPDVVAAVVELVGAITNALPGIITNLTEWLPEIIWTLVDALTLSAPMLLDAAVDLLLVIVDAIPLLIETLAPMVPDIVLSIVDTLIGSTQQLLDGALQLLYAIIDAIPLLIETLVPMIPEIVYAIALALLDATPQLLDAAVELLLAIVEAIPIIIVELVKALPKIWEAMGSYLKQLPSKIWEILKSVVSNFTKWGTEGRAKMLDGAKNIVSAVIDTLKNLPKKVLSVGKDLVTGLWSGVSDKLTWLKDKISGFASSVLDSIKGFFGVHSPSTETAWIGEMLDEGLAEGVLDHANDPVKAMQRVSGSVLDAATGEINGLSIERQLRVSGGAGGSGQAAAVDTSSLLAKLDGIYERLGRIKMVTDRGALVGEIVDIVDAALADRQLLNARGV